MTLIHECGINNRLWLIACVFIKLANHPKAYVATIGIPPDGFGHLGIRFHPGRLFGVGPAGTSHLPGIIAKGSASDHPFGSLFRPSWVNSIAPAVLLVCVGLIPVAAKFGYISQHVF
jgi:hypothetical protein